MKKIKLLPAQVKELAMYVDTCLIQDWLLDSKTFTDLLHFHLQQIKHTLHKKALDIMYKGRKSVMCSFTYGEIITLSYVFKHLELPPYLKALEFDVLMGL